MTPILGSSCLGPRGWRAAQLWAESRGSARWLIEHAPRYWSSCGEVDLRPEVLFAHACKESGHGWFPGVIDQSFHNPAGIKTARGGDDLDPAAHERFPCWEDGVRAHVNHVLAYVHGADARFLGEPHGRALVVQSTSWAGTIRYVEELGGRWAPSPRYGPSLVRHFLQPLHAFAGHPG